MMLSCPLLRPVHGGLLAYFASCQGYLACLLGIWSARQLKSLCAMSGMSLLWKPIPVDFQSWTGSAFDPFQSR